MKKLITSTDLEAAWGHEQPSKVEAELNDADWYWNTYIPNVRKALRGEPVDRALLCGGTEQANDDEQWDSRVEENWS